MKVLAGLLLSAGLGIALIANPVLPFALAFGLIYFRLVFRKPEIALFLTFLAIFNFFSMTHEDLFRIPRVFRIRDLFFLSMFIPLFKDILVRPDRLRYLLDRPMSRCVLMILILCAVQMVFTKFRFPEQSMNSIVRIGRKYFYYALYFPALLVLRREESQERFIRYALVAVFLFCLLYLLQFVLGPSIRIIRNALLQKQVIQGFTVNRIYAEGTVAAALVFHTSLMVFLFSSKSRSKGYNITTMLATGMQNLLTFGRAHILGIVAGTAAGIFCALRKLRSRGVYRVLTVIVLLVLLESVTHRIFYPGKKSVSSAVLSRIVSTYSALVNVDDTLGTRLEDSYGRIQLIKRHPFLGIGFVHEESDIFWRTKTYSIGESIRTVDSGLITFMLDFGLVGMLVLAAVSAIFLRRAIRTYRELKEGVYKAMILGLISFYCGRIFCFITMSDFVSYDGIVVIALAFALLEVIHYRFLEASGARP